MLVLTDENVLKLLPLVQEYQIEKITDKCEEHLLGEANCVKNFLIAQKFDLKKLHQANLAYLHRAPISRLVLLLLHQIVYKSVYVDHKLI